MSTVLRFRRSTRGEGERALPATPCEIVIFPGVRIERHAEPQCSDTNEIAFESRDVRSDAPVSRTY